MKLSLYIVLIFSILACSNEPKVVLLPAIDNAAINEITDVSPVYIFYNTNKKDSVELNKNNLISTTNWLVNIDKRLKLNQIIPALIELQDKKRDKKMHNNTLAKNYFSCNDLSKQTLGFINFTEVHYQFESANHYVTNLGIQDTINEKVVIEFNANNDINIYYPSQHQLKFKGQLSDILEKDVFKNPQKDMIYVAFNGKLSFQQYISGKRKLEILAENEVTIATTEYIIN